MCSILNRAAATAETCSLSPVAGEIPVNYPFNGYSGVIVMAEHLLDGADDVLWQESAFKRPRVRA